MALNPDGYSVKGCSVIYAPAGQAGEYAKLATNPYRGCGHACVYCYVPAAIRMSRADFDAGAAPKPNFLERLATDAAKYQAHGIREQVLLSFTTDPYCLADVEHELTRWCLEVLRNYDLAFCALTKGGAGALRDLDLFRPDRDAFASTGDWCGEFQAKDAAPEPLGDRVLRWLDENAGLCRCKGCGCGHHGGSAS